MQRNMGTLDRLVRSLVVAPAAVLVAMWFGLDTVGGIVALIVAGVMVATSVVGFCPLYALTGTCTIRSARSGGTGRSA